MNTPYCVRIAQCKTFHIGIKSLSKFFEFSKSRSKMKVRVFAIEKDTDDGLCCACIVDNLEIGIGL